MAVDNSDGRKRHWKWTVWLREDSLDRNERAVKDILSNAPQGSIYHVFQVEMGSNEEGKEDARLHFQGHTSFRHPIQFTTFKQRLGISWAWCNWVRPGDVNNSIAYAQKEESRVRGPYEFGERPNLQQGKRSDLSLVAEKIKNGSSLTEIARDYGSTYVRNYRGLAALQALLFPPKLRPDVKITVLYGPAGTGKSTRAYNAFPNGYTKDNSRWWDGYGGEKQVIWDEFDPSVYTSQEWCFLMDKFPRRVQIKGGYVGLHAEQFIITCNQDPDEWNWKNQADMNWHMQQAVRRRITKKIQVTNFEEEINLFD